MGRYRRALTAFEELRLSRGFNPVDSNVEDYARELLAKPRPARNGNSAIRREIILSLARSYLAEYVADRDLPISALYLSRDGLEYGRFSAVAQAFLGRVDSWRRRASRYGPKAKINAAK